MLIDQAECDACKLLLPASDPEHKPPYRGGGIILLDGQGTGWALNHYGSSEGYLGWIALTTVEHREQISDLSPVELMEIGPHLRQVDQFLRDYWERCFHDPVEQVYVNCFMEGLHDLKYSRPAPSPWHFHFRLIPRFQSLDPLMREYQDSWSSGVNAWEVYKLSKRADFPRQYHPDKDNTKALMDYLGERFGRALV